MSFVTNINELERTKQQTQREEKELNCLKPCNLSQHWSVLKAGKNVKVERSLAVWSKLNRPLESTSHLSSRLRALLAIFDIAHQDLDY